ncbi:methyltransferase-like protein 17, mitochondrial isoform X2 [Cephus cinctus]|nr:methyltransferase-like protein 17, mitochondrial isoform X2 [Cephus cinctus]
MSINTVDLPNSIVKAIEIAMEDHPKNVLLEDGQKLARYLWERHAPLEQADITAKYEEIEKEILDKHLQKNGISVDTETLKQRYRPLVIKLCKQKLTKWEFISYDAYKSLSYMAGRSIQNYAVMCKIFNEISIRDKEFQPQSLFDFGSGIGSVMWAASRFWLKSIKEYFCVDISLHMNELSEQIILKSKPKINNIFYRQFLPASPNPPYDIVVSAYSLMELPNTESRLQTILKLWRKTNKYLVIVEQGTNAGFKLVNEARDFVLHVSKKNSQKISQSGYTFSPCPQDLKCPRYKELQTPCNFEVSYISTPFISPRHTNKERYSYVIMRKGERPKDDEQWPRIVRPILMRSRHTICRLCTKEGNLQEIILTKSKHGKVAYRCAKGSNWGDMLPLEIVNEKKDNNSDNDATVEDVKFKESEDQSNTDNS